jgi:hexosaminidase
MGDIEYLAFPRLPGIAEVAWSAASTRNWDEYKIRLGNHGPRMKAMGIDFYPSTKVKWAEE